MSFPIFKLEIDRVHNLSGLALAEVEPGIEARGRQPESCSALRDPACGQFVLHEVTGMWHVLLEVIDQAREYANVFLRRQQFWGAIEVRRGVVPGGNEAVTAILRG